MLHPQNRIFNQNTYVRSSDSQPCKLDKRLQWSVILACLTHHLAYTLSTEKEKECHKPFEFITRQQKARVFIRCLQYGYRSPVCLGMQSVQIQSAELTEFRLWFMSTKYWQLIYHKMNRPKNSFGFTDSKGRAGWLARKQVPGYSWKNPTTTIWIVVLVFRSFFLELLLLDTSVTALNYSLWRI